MSKKNPPAKPHNGGEWTEARKHSFITTALRRAQWPQKYRAIAAAFVENGINPKTGRKIKLHRCKSCRGLFMMKDLHADHIVPVVPLDGFDSWDNVIGRLYCEKEGFQVLCHACHKVVTAKERIERARRKKMRES